MSRSHVLLIGGRSGVGKSTVAAEVHRQLSEYGVHHAWIEGDNLDMALRVIGTTASTPVVNRR